MDYLEKADVRTHIDWAHFLDTVGEHRIILSTTRSATPYHTFSFQPGDILLFGRESAGVPDSVHNRADGRIVIPMAEGMRSLNVATAAAISLSEALRQTSMLPDPCSP